MNTPAILKPISFTADATPSAKRSGTPADKPFNLVLSRQMADCGNANSVTKPGPAAQNVQSANKAGTTNSTENTEPASVDTGIAPPVTDSRTAPVQDSKAVIDDVSRDDAAELAAVSDALLALVANISQIAAPQTVASEDAAPVAHTAEDKTAVEDIVGAQTVVASSLAVVAPASAPAPAADPTQPAAIGQAVATAMPKASVPVNDRAAVKADVSDMPAEPDDFDAAMTQSRDRKPAEADDAKTAPDAAVAKAPSVQAESAPMRQPQETQVARSALPQESQPATTPINFATQAQAPLSQLQAATGQAVEKLTPRVGSPGWDQALGQKVVWMVAGEQQSASLTLNPPDLGPLQVVLEVSNNQATASFTSAQPEVRQALESAMPKLREMLGEAGIQLGQANVSAGTPNNQQSGFGEQQQGSRGFDSRKESDDTPARVTRSQPITGGQGLVDTFA